MSKLSIFYNDAKLLVTSGTDFSNQIFYLIRKGKRATEEIPGLDKLLTKNNIIQIDISTLTISDQVKLFSQAKGLISSGGAVWANLMFSPPGQKIVNFVGTSASIALHHRFIAFAKSVEMMTIAVEEGSTSKHADVLDFLNAPIYPSLDDWKTAISFFNRHDDLVAL